MSVYQLTPPPSIGIQQIPFATWNDGLTDDDIANIIDIGDKNGVTNATIGENSNIVDDIRNSHISWITLNNETQFIYDKLGYISRQLNGQFFDFDIWGFVEDLQYTVYDGNETHYTWHLDSGGMISNSPRKLSMVLQLSDPSEYEGGDLEIFAGPEPTKIEKKKGLIVAFPSFMLHRVTPVTRGIRRTLVVWLSGPRFK